MNFKTEKTVVLPIEGSITVAINNDIIIAVNRSNGQYIRSTDAGSTWSSVATLPSTSGTLGKISYFKNGIFVVTHTTSSYVWRSTDNGLTWARVTTTQVNTTLSATDGNVLVTSITAGAASGGIAHSTDGSTFTTINLVSVATTCVDITYFKGNFYAVINGRLFRSATGNSGWVEIPVTSLGSFSAITKALVQLGDYLRVGLVETFDGGLTWKYDSTLSSKPYPTTFTKDALIRFSSNQLTFSLDSNVFYTCASQAGSVVALTDIANGKEWLYNNSGNSTAVLRQVTFKPHIGATTLEQSGVNNATYVRIK